MKCAARAFSMLAFFGLCFALPVSRDNSYHLNTTLNGLQLERNQRDSQPPHFSQITLVTAYFPLKQAKHSQDDYLLWMSYFIGRAVTPVVVFTTEEFRDKIITIRGQLPIHVVTTFESPLDIPEIKPYAEVFDTAQHDMDPEKDVHNSFLYAVWNGKPAMLRYAAIEDVFHSSYFLWVDIGYFRDGYQYSNWPDINRLRSVLRHNPDHFLVCAIWELDSSLWNQTSQPVKADFIEGGFLGGRKLAVFNFAKLYFDTLKEMLQSGFFVGKDQYMINLMVVRNPHSILVVPSYLSCINDVIFDIWFFMCHVLADPKEVPANIFQRIENVTGVHADVLFRPGSYQALCETFAPQSRSTTTPVVQALAPMIRNPVTLVTAYFPFRRSTHAHEVYLQRMSSFLARITTPIVIFTTPEYRNAIEALRGALPVSIITKFASPMEIPEMEWFVQPFNQWQHDMDPEKDRNDPVSLAFWSCKPALLKHAAIENAFHSRMYFWFNTNFLIDTPFSHWPNPDRIEAFLGQNKEGLLFHAVADSTATFHNQLTDKTSKELVTGDFFGGMVPDILSFTTEYYATLQTMVSRNFFVGKNREIFHVLVENHAQEYFALPSFANCPVLKRESRQFAESLLADSSEMSLEEWNAVHLAPSLVFADILRGEGNESCNKFVFGS